MQVNKISFEKVNFPNIICDYLSKKEGVQPFYNLFPSVENFKKQIQFKKQTFTKEQRNLLKYCLKKQYKKLSISNLTQRNIENISSENTWTITTGHQLNLFTGPLYFLYKIISTINLAKDLQQKYSEENFVPVYWMASEDHDFAEINHFYFKEQRIVWDTQHKGAVANKKTKGLDKILKTLKTFLNSGKLSKKLIDLFEKSYLKNNNIADATRVLVYHLFDEYGLIIIDANEKILKKEFEEVIKKEITEQVSFKTVQKTNENLSKKYTTLINPREINLFYLKNNIRERIVLNKNHQYQINHTDIVFSREQILEEVEKYPERFSTNVILRPIYQEFILPNICYIGGAKELSYWLQLKNLFDELKIIFPILHLRNSALLISKKQYKKLQKLKVCPEDMFLSEQLLIKKKVKSYETYFNLDKEKQFIKNLFENLVPKVNDIDYSLHAKLKAQQKKQIKGFDYLEKKLYKALKTKHQQEIKRLVDLQKELFPQENFQERIENFSRFYLEIGDDFIPLLMKYLDPWKFYFYVLIY